MSEAPRYPDTEGESLEKRVNLLEDYIVKLHRYIRYANEHIGSRNFTKTLRGKILKIDDIDGLSLTVKKADGTTSEVRLEDGILDLQGMVFNILSAGGIVGTQLNGAEITIKGSETIGNLKTDGLKFYDKNDDPTVLLGGISVPIVESTQPGQPRKVLLEARDDADLYLESDNNIEISGQNIRINSQNVTIDGKNIVPYFRDYSGSVESFEANVAARIDSYNVAKGTYLVLGSVTFAAGPAFIQCCLSDTAADSVSPSWNAVTRGMAMDSNAGNQGKESTTSLTCSCYGIFSCTEERRIHLMTYQNGGSSNTARKITNYQISLVRIS